MGDLKSFGMQNIYAFPSRLDYNNDSDDSVENISTWEIIYIFIYKH